MPHLIDILDAAIFLTPVVLTVIGMSMLFRRAARHA
jgi:hypothetical protein